MCRCTPNIRTPYCGKGFCTRENWANKPKSNPMTKELLIEEANFYLKLSGDIERFKSKAFGEDFPFKVLEARGNFGLGIDLLLEQFKMMNLNALRLHAELLKQAHNWD